MTALIAMCGLDGAGKSTQLGLLAQGLRAEGLTVLDFPNPTLAGIRRAWARVGRHRGQDHLGFLGASSYRRIAASLKLLHLLQVSTAARRSAADAVLVDRYTYCQYAAAASQDAGDIEGELRELFAEVPQPDLTIYLEAPPDVCARRIAARGMDTESVDFLRRFDAAYRSLPEFAGFTAVDGDDPPEVVVERLLTAVRGPIRRAR